MGGANANRADPKSSPIRLSLSPSAGVLIALGLGAAPAALLGLEFAWLVVSVGASVLLLSPWLARQQVKAVVSATIPSSVVLHAGRATDQPVELLAQGRPRSLFISLVPAVEISTGERRAPQTWIPRWPAPGRSSRRERGSSVRTSLPMRLGTRGSSKGVFLRVESSFPFGLVAARRLLHLPCSITALPRLVSERDLISTDLLARPREPDRMSESRAAPRGQGLPLAFRAARMGDTMREVQVRPSLRRGRWIAAERAEMDSSRATLVIEFPSARRAATKRGHAALEAAISVAASLVLRWTREGRDVEVAVSREVEGSAPDGGDSSAVQREVYRLGASRRALPLLRALAHLTGQGALAGRAQPGPEAIYVRPVLGLVAESQARALQVDPEGRVLLPPPRLPSARSFAMARRSP